MRSPAAPTVNSDSTTGDTMNPQDFSASIQTGDDSRLNWRADLARMGLSFTDDGSSVTLTPQAMPYLFGRAALYNFRLTMAATALLRLRRLLTSGDDSLHLPVRGHIVAYDGTVRPTNRLIAAGSGTNPRLVLEVTTWLTAADGSQAWLDTHLLDNLSSADLEHFNAVRGLWGVGVHPMHRAERYVAAGLSAADAQILIRTDAPSDREAKVDLLAALRTC
jgi:hypothetical protein